MLFNTHLFIFIFLPLTLIIYFYLNLNFSERKSKLFLIISSLFFYSWWNIIYLPFLLGSIVFNYYIGSSLADKSSKPLLFLGISINLFLIGYFKYSDFFISNVNTALDADIGLLHLALPLAISFFTFQQIAYLVDNYRQKREKSDFLNYALFVTFFPQLIAGPIVHYGEMIPQFKEESNRFVRYKNIAMGLFIFSIGLFKKIVIADTFAKWATSGFDGESTLHLLEAWVTSLSYTFQLYFDFSGYTDMAIGVALLFNIKLPINFNSPYRARNIQEFWRRWHITLSLFLQNYIYIPLGGNRGGVSQTYLNIMITFLLGGLWHGAAWTFVFWGFLHGMALIIYRIWIGLDIQLPLWLAWFLTFNFINFSWIFFRAEEWGDAMRILSGMLGLNGFVYLEFEWKYMMLLGTFFVVLMVKNSNSFIEGKRELNYIYALFIASVLMLFHFISLEVEESPFLYFNF